MIESFIAGALAGLAIAIPVGAIAILIVDTGLRRGFRPASAAGFGAASADGIYAGIAALFGAVIATFLEPWIPTLRLASVVVLLAIAIRGFLAVRGAGARPGGGEGADGPGFLGTYVRFLGLTLINPQTVVYFAALIVGLPTIGTTSAERAAFVAGAFVASAAWQQLLAGFGAIAHHRLPPATRTVTSIVGNLLIVAFALRIALEG